MNMVKKHLHATNSDALLVAGPWQSQLAACNQLLLTGEQRD